MFHFEEAVGKQYMYTKPLGHMHRCLGCKTEFSCHGWKVDNPDGWPEKYCAAWPPDTTPICQDCREQGLCDSGHSGACEVVGSVKLGDLWVCANCFAVEVVERISERDTRVHNGATTEVKAQS